MPLFSAPVCLNPVPLLWIVANVDSPEVTIFPETPIEIGELDLENPDILPQENFPTGFVVLPVVAIPTIEDDEWILQVILPLDPDEFSWCMLYILSRNDDPIPTIEEFELLIEVTPFPTQVSKI